MQWRKKLLVMSAIKTVNAVKLTHQLITN